MSPHKVFLFYFANETYKALVLLDYAIVDPSLYYREEKKKKTLCYKLQVYLPQFYSFMFEKVAFTFKTHINKI
jgi:hypothetical protein